MTPDRSAVYEGTVFHRRLEPIGHALRYPLRMPLLDLGELPGSLDAHPLWSARRASPVRFRPADFLRKPGRRPARGPEDLAERAWELAEPELAPARRGPVQVLASPRVLGMGFNPVSFIYLFEPDGERVRLAIAEVTNTPWGERTTYVVRRDGDGGPLRATVPKRMHVSPFNGMEQTYELSVSEPGERLEVSIANVEGGRTVFEAGLAMRRLPLTRTELGRTFARQPLGPIGTLARIYGQALRLKLKGAPHHPHPTAAPRPEARTE
jgi:DUF1365 family protein